MKLVITLIAACTLTLTACGGSNDESTVLDSTGETDQSLNIPAKQCEGTAEICTVCCYDRYNQFIGCNTGTGTCAPTIPGGGGGGGVIVD